MVPGLAPMYQKYRGTLVCNPCLKKLVDGKCICTNEGRDSDCPYHYPPDSIWRFTLADGPDNKQRITRICTGPAPLKDDMDQVRKKFPKMDIIMMQRL